MMIRILFLLLLSAPLVAGDLLDLQRTAFLGAEILAKKGQPIPSKLEQSLRSYPLYPYLEYYRLKKNLHRISSQKIAAFFERYPDLGINHLLRRRWLAVLAKQKKWQDYLQFYQPQKSIELQCHYLHALIATGQKQKAFEQVEPIWLSGRSRPKACDPVFAAWKKAGKLSKDLIWQRIELSMDQGQIRLARYLARSLPKKERAWLEEWIQLYKKPQLLLKKTLKSAYAQAILVDAMQQAIRQDALSSIELWQKVKKQADEDSRCRVEGYFARYLKRNQQAWSFLQNLQPCTSNYEHFLLAALWQQDWASLKTWLERFSLSAMEEERWQYWYARALQAIGQKRRADHFYLRLAKERSYYGFLAADRVQQDYHFAPAKTEVDQNIMNQLSKLPGIARVKEWLALERWTEARREWYVLTKKMDQEEYKAAAKLAQSWSWLDQAIFTLAKSAYWDDLELRFPIEYRDWVEHYAAKNQLDPSWVYGILRQESAFNPQVRSRAGAMGLMQLMPDTARFVLKKLLQKPVPKSLQKALQQPEFNIELGTAYLSYVADRFDQNPVLATAAYNAGPHRVERWLPDQDMPADIWAELIPFKETRRYVRRVMTYSAIYDHRLGRPLIRLSTRMTPIKGQKHGD